MKKYVPMLVAAILVVLSVVVMADDTLSKHLQDVSVTIHSGRGQGSGVIVTREIAGEKVNFVWTAAHVVDGLRTVRTVIDPGTGTPRQVVEFADASIVKELVEDGRRVGELKMDAKVVRFSNIDNGEDLALLEVRKKDFVNASAKFFLEKNIPSIGTRFYHVGSLLGQLGSNSMTTGISSQIGRTIGTKEFDQTTVTAFPGSSGGGVFLTEDAKDHQGEYVGMLVRGAGETFNLVVPVRRMHKWATSAKVAWALDPSIPAPSADERAALPIEDIGVSFKAGSNAAAAPVTPTAPEHPHSVGNRLFNRDREVLNRLSGGAASTLLQR